MFLGVISSLKIPNLFLLKVIEFSTNFTWDYLSRFKALIGGKMASFILYIKWNCKWVLCMDSYLFPLSSPAFFFLVNALRSSSQHFSPNIMIWYSLTRAVFLILREVRLDIRLCIPRDRNIDFTARAEDWLGLGKLLG